jgi:hypothetical protein
VTRVYSASTLALLPLPTFGNYPYFRGNLFLGRHDLGCHALLHPQYSCVHLSPCAPAFLFASFNRARVLLRCVCVRFRAHVLLRFICALFCVFDRARVLLRFIYCVHCVPHLLRLTFILGARYHLTLSHHSITLIRLAAG